jgi:hypothetical protein
LPELLNVSRESLLLAIMAVSRAEKNMEVKIKSKTKML